MLKGLHKAEKNTIRKMKIMMGKISMVNASIQYKQEINPYKPSRKLKRQR